MSADNVSVCPKCGDGELREWWELFSDAELRGDYSARPSSVTVNYRCECRSCRFEDDFSATHVYAVSQVSP